MVTGVRSARAEAQGQRNGEEAWGKWGSKAAKPPNPLRTLPFTNPWCYHLPWSSLNLVVMGFNWGLDRGNLMETLAIVNGTQYQYSLLSPEGLGTDHSNPLIISWHVPDPGTHRLSKASSSTYLITYRKTINSKSFTRPGAWIWTSIKNGFFFTILKWGLATG